ncbi:hypothetical protein DL93DRAFT_261568 [Clavulina sp. PMI_390]|nr:hypothetical protein DL93DRAFT_261568 [Clavulina sp. PMI_390]
MRDSEAKNGMLCLHPDPGCSHHAVVGCHMVREQDEELIGDSASQIASASRLITIEIVWMSYTSSIL